MYVRYVCVYECMFVCMYVFCTPTYSMCFIVHKIAHSSALAAPITAEPLSTCPPVNHCVHHWYALDIIAAKITAPLKTCNDMEASRLKGLHDMEASRLKGLNKHGATLRQNQKLIWQSLEI